MRVAVDVRLLEASGIGRYLREILPRLVERGPHEYALLGDPAEIARTFGVDSRVASIEARTPIYSLAEQWELLRRTPPDAGLFWAPHYHFPLLRRGRVLLTVHDVLHLARPEYVAGIHGRMYARAMFAAGARRAAAVICVSRFTADELVRRTGTSARRVRVVHNGVARDWFEPAVGESPHERPYFLYVGNVKPHKNLRRLVEAFGEVSRALPHDLVIVGKRAGFRTGNEALARRAGERVRFTGPVPEGELRRFVSHATALVFPSLYEGFGLPPLEAMAAGCPAVVARAAAIPEVCGEAALYFDPLDPGDIARALSRVAREPALRAELIGRGRERAGAFRWERSAEETAAVIDEVLSSG